MEFELTNDDELTAVQLLSLLKPDIRCISRENKKNVKDLFGFLLGRIIAVMLGSTNAHRIYY